MLPRTRWWRENPYLDLLEDALRALGVETSADEHDGLSWRWLLEQRGAVDVLHFHWLHYHYDRDTWRQSSWALAKFTSKLMLAKALRYRIVWTAHNLQPHEPRHPGLDRLCRLAVCRLADHVIVHGEQVRFQLGARFGRRRNVHVLPHPNYVGVYPDPIDQEAARRQLALDRTNRVFLCFGALRPYKGFQEAIVAFNQLPDDEARLIIAGSPLDQRIAAEITGLARGDRRIRTVLEFIPRSAVPTYFAAADAVVLPFRTIATSGSVMLAMSFARPVVAPALGCLPDWVTRETGILYDAHDAEALLKAMKRCCELDLETMGRLAYERVARFTAHEVARRHLAVYAN